MEPSEADGQDAFLRELEAQPHYAVIARDYAGKIARRSGVPYIKHIRDGAQILYRLFEYGPADDVVAAYCVHPLFQSDRSLTRLLSPEGAADLAALPERVLVLAMEYRRIANSYTIKDTVRAPEAIEIGPIEEVRRMLIADKIQNRMDFATYMVGAHDRTSYNRATERSLAYFDSWLARLGISMEQYAAVTAQVQASSDGGSDSAANRVSSVASGCG